MSNTVICACKNRNKPLTISLTSWLHNKNIDEIIVVDWSSDEPLFHLAKLDSRIKIVRVNNQQYFNQQQPLNLAIQLAEGKNILKLDCDYILNPYYNFFDHYKIDSKSFVCGEFDSAENLDWNEFIKPLRGLLYCTKQNLMDVGGYEESMGEIYGYEDGELENRLVGKGLEKKKLEYDHFLIHIPHPNSYRYENFKNGKEVINSELQKLLDEFEYKKAAGHYTEEQRKWLVDYYITQQNIKVNMEKFKDNQKTKAINSTCWGVKKIDTQLFEGIILE